VERDLPRISRALVRYFEVRASGGRCLSEHEARDPLMARHLALIDRIVRAWEARNTGKSIRRRD
jgi:hypothetical protein